MPDLESLSNGYYTLELYVSPYEAGPVVERDLLRYIEDEIYAAAGVDAEVWFRTEMDRGTYFTPDHEVGIPPDTMGMPRELMEEVGIKNLTGRRHLFLVAKPLHADYIEQSLILENSISDIPEDVKTSE